MPLGAVCACFGYLAFPQSAAAFAVLWIGMLILGKRYGEPKHRGAWVLLGSCAVCGVVFLVYALSGVEFSISLLLSRLTLILHDPQYNFTTAQRHGPAGRPSIDRSTVAALAAASLRRRLRGALPY